MLFGSGTRSQNANGTDRRTADRFPIEREIRYKVVGRKGIPDAGAGKTLNISSNGVLFTTEQMLIPGRKLEMSISWPAQLDNHCMLKLVARGRVVRSEHGRTAVEIQQYEFRTQGSNVMTIR